MTGDARGALVAAAAYTLMFWLDRRPPSWWYGRPRPDRARPDQPVHGELRRTGRELERRRP